MNNTAVEGRLSIDWANWTELGATPNYNLLFYPNKDSRDGGPQRPYNLVGTENLESHLTELGITSEDAKNLIKQVHAEKTVFISNVMMPQQYLSVYLPRTA